MVTSKKRSSSDLWESVETVCSSDSPELRNFSKVKIILCALKSFSKTYWLWRHKIHLLSVDQQVQRATQTRLLQLLIHRQFYCEHSNHSHKLKSLTWKCIESLVNRRDFVSEQWQFHFQCSVGKLCHVHNRNLHLWFLCLHFLRSKDDKSSSHSKSKIEIVKLFKSFKSTITSGMLKLQEASIVESTGASIW